jgi:hypothetical protein
MRGSIWFLLMVLTLVQCKTNGHVVAMEDSGLPNATKEYFLHIKNEEDGRLSFYVTLKGSTEKLVQRNILPGYVKWSGMYEIEYFDAPGIVPVEYDMTVDTQRIFIKSRSLEK